MKLALDTNRYVDLMTPLPQIVAIVEQAAEVFMPFAVLAELRAGFQDASRRSANESVLEKFMSRPFVRPLFPDDRTIDMYAKLYSELRRGGRMIPTNDLWIAALCVQHGLTLCSRDRHFDSLPQLARV